MITYVADMTDPAVVEKVEIAYYLLFSKDLQCIVHKNTPEREHLLEPRVIVVVAEEKGKIVGVLMVDNNSVLFPVMTGDYYEVLRALIQKAYEVNNEYLEAYTENQLILETAVDMGLNVQRDGNRIWKGLPR